MGRVRRYKKFKACDPFSKKSSAPIDTVHDEPPEMFEQRSKRKENRFKNNLGVDDEDDEYEKYIRRAMLKSASTSEKVSALSLIIILKYCRC